MKAMLVNIDLLVRVIVEDDATEEQVISKAVDKAQSQSNDRTWFSEGISEIYEDTECPYDSETDKVN